MSDDVPVCLLIVAFTGALLLLLPHLSPLRYFFAIMVPVSFRSTPAAHAALRRYYAVTIAGILIGAAVVLTIKTELAPVWAMLIPSMIAMGAFFRERNHVAAAAPRPDGVRVADLQSEEDHLPRWIALVLPPFAVPVAIAFWLRSHWNEIPQRFPVHWDLHNQANGWADRTARSVYGPVLMCGGMMLLLVLITLAMFYGSRRGRQRLPVAKMMVATIYFLALIFGFVGLLPLIQFQPMMVLIPSLVFPLGLLIWMVRVLRDPSLPVEETPDRCWYLGAIYVNPADPAIFVQRRIGFGYTLNMGNRLAWMMMAGLLAAAGGLVFVLS